MKLGIAGTGIIVQEVLPLLVEWGWNVTAICGTTVGKAEAMARAHGVPSAFGGYTAMLEQADIDTVYVAVPNFLHFDLCRKALNAGKHVIVEKPMTSNDREARELAALAREKNCSCSRPSPRYTCPITRCSKRCCPVSATLKS